MVNPIPAKLRSSAARLPTDKKRRRRAEDEAFLPLWFGCVVREGAEVSQGKSEGKASGGGGRNTQKLLDVDSDLPPPRCTSATFNHATDAAEPSTMPGHRKQLLYDSDVDEQMLC